MDRYSHTCIHTRAHAPACVQVRFRADDDTPWRLQQAEVRCWCHTERTHARTHSATVCVCLYRAGCRRSTRRLSGCAHIYIYIYLYRFTCMHRYACRYMYILAGTGRPFASAVHTYLPTYMHGYLHTYIHTFMQLYVCSCSAQSMPTRQ